MKITALALGTILCVTYFVFLLTEGDSTVLGLLFGLPFLAWPFVAWKWPNIGAWSMAAVGVVATWLFLISSLFQETSAATAGFITLAFIPAAVISALLFYYWHVEGI